MGRLEVTRGDYKSPRKGMWSLRSVPHLATKDSIVHGCAAGDWSPLTVACMDIEGLGSCAHS